MSKEQEVNNSLDTSLAIGDYGGLKRGDIIKAKQKIHSALQHQEQAKKDLEMSIEKLSRRT